MLLQGWRYHIVGGDTMISDMMKSGLAIETGLRDADFVIFSGGTDISPTLYNEFTSHPKTQNPDKERDRVEQAIFQTAVAKKKLCIGICRGAQLLNVLSGGSLWQHVDGHGNCNHKVTYINENDERYIIDVTSDHHQMMRPSDAAKVWALSGESTFKQTAVFDKNMDKHHRDDPEIVFYKRTKSLCFQPHPEWHSMPCKSLFFDCVKRAMLT